ncbi:hypothetical protein D3C87_1866390 [compost metagenome]
MIIWSMCLLGLRSFSFEGLNLLGLKGFNTMKGENTMTNNKTNEWIKWYWQGWDDYSKLDVPVCPYEYGTQAHKQWWLGYTDAETEEDQ